MSLMPRELLAVRRGPLWGSVSGLSCSSISLVWEGARWYFREVNIANSNHLDRIREYWVDVEERERGVKEKKDEGTTALFDFR